MGIDVYLNWHGRSETEQQAQYTGYRTDAGNVGYLREAYHGGPYATMALLPEGWADEGFNDNGEFEVAASTLKERLPAVVMTAIYRNHIVYEGGTDPSHIEITDMADKLKDVFASTADRSAIEIPRALNEEQRKQMAALIEKRNLPDYALAFVDFVNLAEQKEKETGHACRVMVSA